MRARLQREAHDWRGWLLRAIAAIPRTCRSCTGRGRAPADRVGGRPLPGYRGASPVRVGNGAFTQYQADMFGEVMLALSRPGARASRRPRSPGRCSARSSATSRRTASRGQRHLGDPRAGAEFTHSRAMIWAAFDRGDEACTTRAERPGRPLADSRRLRDEIDERGFDRSGGRTRSTTAVPESTRHSCSFPRSATSPTTTPGCSVRWPRSRTDLMRDGLYALPHGDRRRRPRRPASIRSSPARSGWSSQYAFTGRFDDGTALMDRLLASATTSACCRRSTTSMAGGRPATPRRPCHTLLWSGPPMHWWPPPTARSEGY